MAENTTRNRRDTTPRENGETQQASNGPDYIAYSVRDNGNGRGYWNRVGAAFMHKDGKGMNLELDSVPVNGKLSLREQSDQALNNRNRDQDRDNRSREQDYEQRR